MDVILLEKVANLGSLGDRVEVRSGYARNFLLPKGKATLATPANVTKFEARRAELEKHANEQLSSAEARKLSFADFRLNIAARAGSEGKLFGSIGTGDIAAAASAAGQPLQRSEVRLPNGPLRVVGDHVVVVHLHTDIDVELSITITSEDKA
jgi:large subunit ribosomal protein L9